MNFENPPDIYRLYYPQLEPGFLAVKKFIFCVKNEEFWQYPALKEKRKNIVEKFDKPDRAQCFKWDGPLVQLQNI